MTASLKLLKLEISNLKQLFHKNHLSLQIIESKLEEISCVFVGRNKQAIGFKANIPDNYPQSPAIWFTECDESWTVKLLEKLVETCNTTITDQFKLLLTEICRITSSPLPEEMQKLAPPDYSAVPVEDSDSDSSVILLSDDEDLPLNASCSKTVAEPTAKELSAEQQNILKRLEEKQYYQHNLNFTGSTLATRRLKKELMNIWNSDSFKEKRYTVDLINDNLYEWKVRQCLAAFDPDSPLYQDLKKLKETTGKEGILLHFVFGENYPFDPPLVRVMEPTMSKGHVFEIGGVLCMELLIKQGWSSAYTVEAVIMQIAATFVRGNGRVDFNKTNTDYTLERAQYGLKVLEEMPDRARWTSRHQDG